MSARPRPMSRRAGASPPTSRLLPLTIASAICFIIALILGYGGWYLFGAHNRHASGDVAEIQQTPSLQSEKTTAAPAPVEPQPPVLLAPAGELTVTEGEVLLGGGDTNFPLRREFVEAFAIAETEVTNEQYREFAKATGHKAPVGWKSDEFPPGSALEPVTGVTWQDAVDYCKWLSEKIGANVRLPTEAEWERAARGKDNYKYPWGNEWDERAAASEENKGGVRAVRSYPAGKSPFGAYDMAGNVWEWVADEARDEGGNPIVKDGVVWRIAKGGAASEPAAVVSAISRQGVPASTADPALGFRYVVLRPPVKTEQKP
jgi:formylglycine-generating enzyme required for sulfatase activity